MQKSENSSTDLRTQPCHFACSLACMQSDMVGGMLLPAKAGRCACGFSGLQINILSILKAQHEVISYWQIAILVQSVFGQSTSEDAVRGALGRLYRHGFLVRQRANRAHLKGNRYAFTADPCPHIKAYSTVESARQQPVQSSAQSSQASPPSILEEKDKRNTLSISSQEEDRSQLEALTETDIEFHWPRLAASGFRCLVPLSNGVCYSQLRRED